MTSVVGRVGIEENWFLGTSHFITCKEVNSASIIVGYYGKEKYHSFETMCILSTQPVL